MEMAERKKAMLAIRDRCVPDAKKDHEAAGGEPAREAFTRDVMDAAVTSARDTIKACVEGGEGGCLDLAKGAAELIDPEVIDKMGEIAKKVKDSAIVQEFEMCKESP